ncbi:MAG: glycosyltransferase family 39 protein [Candidatus Azambacteria bacterium]|nr:glycosyltransferase family 39 protein [Candidatus Azambacteria bacterium]
MFISLNNKKTFWHWWFLAAAIYLIFATIITWQYGVNFFISYQDDSATQVLMAKNLISYGTFSLDGDPSSLVRVPTSPLNPTNFLTPGYPFWLVFIFIIFKSFTPAIFIGALIFAFSVPITYFLAQEITGNEKIAFWSAIVFMIEPLSIYHSGILQTEQLFVPLFLAGVYLFIRYLRTNDKKFLYSSLFIFSISTLVRPIIFYFLPVLLLIIAIRELKIFNKKTIIYCLVSLILTYSVVGLWMIRNKVVLDTWQISSNRGAILYAHHYVLLSRYLNIPVREDIVSPNLNRLSVEYNNALEKIAIEEISKHKLDYLKMYSVYLPLFFVSNGYSKLISRFIGTTDFGTNFRNDLVLNFLRGDIQGALRTLLKTPAPVWGLLIGLAMWVIISLLGLVGFWNIFINYGIDKSMIIVLGLLLMYFAAVSTPFIVARYRLPVNPFVFIFAVSGFYFLKNKIKLWI